VPFAVKAAWSVIGETNKRANANTPPAWEGAPCHRRSQRARASRHSIPQRIAQRTKERGEQTDPEGERSQGELKGQMIQQDDQGMSGRMGDSEKDRRRDRLPAIPRGDGRALEDEQDDPGHEGEGQESPETPRGSSEGGDGEPHG
jgi:hypothetical protein